jgi:hypothetical protein
MTLNPKIHVDSTSRAIVAEQGARGAAQEVWNGWCGVTSDSPQWSTIEVPKITDARGSLSVIEFKRGVPFNIERVYYVYKSLGDPNGAAMRTRACIRFCWLLLAASRFTWTTVHSKRR